MSRHLLAPSLAILALSLLISCSHSKPGPDGSATKKDPKGKMRVVRVRTAAELTNALKKAEETGNVRIEVEPGRYVMAYETAIRAEEEGVPGLANVQIWGTDPKKRAEIVSEDRDKAVLHLSGTGMLLRNLSIGHVDTEGLGCMAAALTIYSAERVELVNLDLYGSGTQGLYVQNSEDVRLTDSIVHDCTDSHVTLQQARKVLIDHTRFTTTKGSHSLFVSGATDVEFRQCTFENGAFDMAMFYTQWREGDPRVKIVDSTITGNSAPALLDRKGGLEMKNVKITGNTFSKTP